MKTIYESTVAGNTVTVENGIVTQSDTEFCVVGQKPNTHFLRKCCWRKLPATKRITDIFGGVRYETIYR